MKVFAQKKVSFRFSTRRSIRVALAFSFFISFNTSVFSQSWLWANSSIGTGEDRGESVSADGSGNVFVTGWFNSPSITFGSTTLTQLGADAIYLAKYDATGNVLWAKSADGIWGEEGWAVNADASGNVFVTGSFSSPTITFGSTTLTNIGTSNVFIAKYDANGNVLWAVSATGTGVDLGCSVSADPGGNVFVTGYFSSPTITFGTTTLTNMGFANMFLAKYDALGNFLWAKSAGGTAEADGWSVSADPSGNVFVGGRFNSPNITFGSTTLVNAGNFDVFLAKYDLNGSELWAISGGGTGGNGDEGRSVSTDAVGNVFITGYYTGSSITFGSATLTGTGGVFLVKYDTWGNLLWSRSSSGIAWDVGWGVSAGVNGNVFVSGFISGPTITFGSLTLTPPPGDWPLFIVKYDADGNVLCGLALASGGRLMNGVSADPWGNAYVGGDFPINPFIIGSDTLQLTGIRNIFVAKFTCSTGLTISISQTPPICNGACTGTAAVTAMNGAGPYTYSWNTTPTQTTQTATGLCAGDYEVVVNDASGNADTVSVTIIQPPIIAVNAGTNVTIISGTNTVLTGTGSTGVTYSWSPSSTLTCDTCATTIASPTQTTTYTLTVTANGCSSFDTVTVFVEAECGDLFVPNVFSPNNDGPNDVLKVYGNCITDFEFVIFDRWGEKVFEITNPAIVWDGKYNGKVLETGVFVYYLVGKVKGIEVKKHGNITLVK